MRRFDQFSVIAKHCVALSHMLCHCERGHAARGNLPSAPGRLLRSRSLQRAKRGCSLAMTPVVFLTLAPTIVPAQATTLPDVVVTAERESEKAPTTFHQVIRPSTSARQMTTLPDLLDEAVGTHVRSLGHLGHYSTVSIRGSSAEQVAVYLDGARLNSGGFGAVDLSTIPTEIIDRIEVIRGGGTAQFGSGAVGGVVNIVTKRAEEGTHVEAQMSGGSFLTLRGNVAYHEKKAEKAFLASLTHLSSRGNYSFRQSSTTLAGTSIGGGTVFARDHNESLAESFLVKYETGGLSDTRLQLANDFFFAHRQLPGTEIEATQLAPTNPLEATQQLYRNTTHASVHFDALGSQNVGLQLGLHNQFEANRFEDPSPALGPALDHLAISNTISPFGHFTGYVPTPHGGHTVGARYDLRHELFDDRARNSTTTASGIHNRFAHALLLQDEWSMYDERLLVIPAIRYTRTKPYHHGLDYRMGVMGRPWAPLTLKANIETSARAPTFVELYHPDQGFIRGNDALSAEKAWHWDAGAAVDIGDILHVEADYFQQHIKNSILFVPISATTIAPVNTFNARSEGVEATTRITASDYLLVSGAYTWMQTHFASSGNQLPGRPEHQVSGRLTLIKPMRHRWGAQAYGAAEWQTSVPINVENTTWLGQRTTVDVGIKSTWRTHQGQEYFGAAEAKNVTNIQVYDARGFPLPRRAIYVTVGGKWGA